VAEMRCSARRDRSANSCARRLTMDARTHLNVAAPLVFHANRSGGDLAQRLARVVEGELLFDAASRGRYATDASIYQVEPLGVLVPRTHEDVRAALEVCRTLHVPVLPRGAGSSQCGQTVGAALVIDHTKFLDWVGELDRDAITIDVGPGVVLD